MERDKAGPDKRPPTGRGRAGAPFIPVHRSRGYWVSVGLLMAVVIGVPACLVALNAGPPRRITHDHRPEAMVIGALRIMRTAQELSHDRGLLIVERAGAPATLFARRPYELYSVPDGDGEKELMLVPKALALAETAERAYQGYFYFFPTVSLVDGRALDYAKEYEIVAVPVDPAHPAFWIAGGTEVTGMPLKKKAMGRLTGPADYVGERVDGWLDAD